MGRDPGAAGAVTHLSDGPLAVGTVARRALAWTHVRAGVVTARWEFPGDWPRALVPHRPLGKRRQVHVKPSPASRGLVCRCVTPLWKHLR